MSNNGTASQHSFSNQTAKQAPLPTFKKTQSQPAPQ